MAIREGVNRLKKKKTQEREMSLFVLSLSLFFFWVLNGDRLRSQFKFAESGVLSCSNSPLLVVVSWETDAAETSSTDGEGANLF